MRTEQIVSKALKVTDGDRYKLSLVVAKRVEMLSNGAKILIDNIDTRKMKFADIALLELAEGKIDLDGIIEAN